MNFFWTTFLSVGVQRTDDRKEEIVSWESLFSLEFVFLKNFDCFGMVNQWVYTCMMIKLKKNPEEKTYTECFFEKRVLNNIVISGSTEWQYKKKNSFPSKFFWL